MTTPDALYDGRGQRIHLGAVLGTGGEGTVYELTSQPSLVAKIYHKGADPLRSAKIEALAAFANSDLLEVAAWPTATVREKPDGPVIGLLMPKVTDHKEIHTLYSPAHRKLSFPQADWSFLVRAAMNCAIAFDAVHKTGAVIGDVNQSNVLVSRLATVKLIDCDSCQIAYRGAVYPCEVGVPLFTPPELQGKSFKGIERTANHDRFGLSVLIFHLLFMGRHPFSGRYLDAGEMPIERAIGEHRFAYGGNPAQVRMEPPPHSLPLSAVSPNIASLFGRAFGTGSDKADARPAASEWIAGLAALAAQLQGCRVDPGHVYPKSLAQCPWCELSAHGAPNFFVAVAFAKSTAGATVVLIDVAAIWKRIDRIAGPQRSYVRPATPACHPKPLSPRVRELLFTAIHIPRDATQYRVGIATLVLGLLVIPLCLANGLLGGLVLLSTVVLTGWWLVLEGSRKHVENEIAREREGEVGLVQAELMGRLTAYQNAEQNLLNAERDWHTILTNHETKFRGKKEELRVAKDHYQGLPQLYAEERRKLEASLHGGQLSLYLQGHFLSDQSIEKIGPTRLAVLTSYGIETADDVTREAILKIPGFGEKLAQRLLDWRNEVAGRFVFDPTLGIPESQQRTLDAKYQKLRKQLETKLQTGEKDLQTLVAKGEKEMQQQMEFIKSLMPRLGQTIADLSMIPRKQ